MNPRIRSERELQAARMRGQILPVVTTLAGSLAVLLPFIAESPSLPPFGFMMLLSWRLLRPELWPVWIGLPLGLFDDLVSGQPIGSAMMLWTLALLVLDLIDQRLVWRDYWQDWLMAAALIIAVLLGGLITANGAGGEGHVLLIVPQILVSILIFPVVARVCALLDRWRLS
ncbi:rod shape-determining protein MreD [Sphingobium boeckii]|uniref:Rod shape-determining protein MreD n=1 Tax=Sphingobium boeckii TaxID=1082345 RepID=A0A7W9EFP6_9SPHN|nr:rod shape-determining protein MreD [Sphingobium boeckii]MBB5687482.1 rod shape-determining protein MreD [Sphingobium boeckii]